MMKHISIFLVLMFFTVSGIAQYTYSGIIKDAGTDEPLIGASIAAGEEGAITDIYGHFSFDSKSEYLDATVSYVGYETIYISLLPDEPIEITLSGSAFLLDAAIITGNKYETPITEAVSSISVIKPNLIADANIATVDNLLDKVPGVQMQDGQANIRGGSGYSYGAGSRVLVLVDEIPAFQADVGRVNWNDIPIENIAQIEVLKGASSVLYGSSAMNGIINMRTGEAGSVPITKLSAQTTVYGPPSDERAHWWKGELLPYEWNVSALHKRKLQKVDLVLSGFYGRSTPVYKDAFNNRGRLFAKAKYRIKPNMTFELTSQFNQTRNASHLLWRNNTTGQYDYTAGTLSESLGTRFYLDPVFTIFDQNGGRHKIFARYFATKNDVSDSRSNQSDYYSAEYQYLKTFASLDATITGGITASRVASDSELFSDTLVTGRNAAAYAQIEKAIGRNFDVTLGGRVESNWLNAPPIVNGVVLPNGGAEQESRAIFRAGAHYEIAEYSHLRASFGQAYRYPTITEKFISTTVGSFVIFPNVELQSETGWSAEVGFKQGFQLGEWRGFGDIAIFLNKYNNMTEFTLAIQDEGFGFKSLNVGDTEIKGVELEVGGESALFGVPVRVIGGYTFIDPKYRNFDDSIAETSSTTENILKYRTRHNAKVDVQVTLTKLLLGLSYQYSSEMVAIDNLFFAFNDFVGMESYRETNTTAYQLLDARIGFKIGDLKFTLFGNNLLNHKIMKRPARLEPPRNAALRIDYQF